MTASQDQYPAGQDEGRPTRGGYPAQDGGATRGGGARVFPRDGHALRRPPVLFRIPEVRVGAGMSLAGEASQARVDAAQAYQDVAVDDRLVSDISDFGSKSSAGLDETISPHHQDVPRQGPAAPHFALNQTALNQTAAAVSADSLPTTEGPVTHRLEGAADETTPAGAKSLPGEVAALDESAEQSAGFVAEPDSLSPETAAPVVPSATSIAESKVEVSSVPSVEIPPIVPEPSGRSWMEAYGSKLIPLLLIAAVVTYALLLNGNGTPEPEMILADLELNEGAADSETGAIQSGVSNESKAGEAFQSDVAGVAGVSGNSTYSTPTASGTLPSASGPMPTASDAGTAGDVTSVTPDFDLSTLMREQTAASGQPATPPETGAEYQASGDGRSQQSGAFEAPMMQLDPPRATGRFGESNDSAAALPQERANVQYPLVSRTGQPIREPDSRGGTTHDGMGAEHTSLSPSGSSLSGSPVTGGAPGAGSPTGTSAGWQVDQEMAAAAAAAGLPYAGVRSSDPPSAQAGGAAEAGGMIPGSGAGQAAIGGYSAPIRENQWAQPNASGGTVGGVTAQRPEEAIHAAVEAAVSGSFVAPEGPLPNGQSAPAGGGTGIDGYWTTGQPASIPDWRRYLPGTGTSGAGIPNGGPAGESGVIQFFPQQGAIGGAQPLGAPTGQAIPAGASAGGAVGPQLQPPQVSAGAMVPPPAGVPTANYGIPPANNGLPTAGAGTWPPQAGAGATSNR